MTGTKRYLLDLDVTIGGQRLAAVYDTLPRVPVSVAGTELETLQGHFGGLWSSSLHKKLVLGASSRGARVYRGSGRSVSFSGDGSGTFTPDGDINDRLLSISAGYRYFDAAEGAEETYDTQGQLSRIDRADGTSLIYSYSTSSTPATIAPAAGYLLSVTDQFARSVQFAYDSAGRISKITGTDGSITTPAYSGTNLSQLTWPDTQVRKFLYENTTFAWALTGITDENNARHATIGYDPQGRAISTELAGGVNRYSTSYSQPPTVVVTDTYDATANLVFRSRSWQAPSAPLVSTPNGSTLALGIGTVANVPGMTSQSQPAGSGCSASSNAIAYDTNGNVASRNDFNGSRVCSAYDLSRSLETTRVEGLANTQACSAVTAASSTLPTRSRKVSTVWHPDWKLEAKRAEPGKLTTSIYNGQPDPFNGNAIASCAPSTALLPDGKPIAVLCKQVEQATSDANGSQGLSASLQAGVANRVQQWTYNAVGQVLTAKDPLNNTTTYTYYADTTADHTLGDLQTLTNAKNQVTSYTKYNKHGQLLGSTDPNGALTVNTYDLRQRLLSASVAGQITSYEYDAAGQLLKVTSPDQSWIGYEYDAAHRQTAVKDNLGNRIEYVLDNAGNKTGQSVKDPLGNLARSLARSIDALGRVQQATGRE